MNKKMINTNTVFIVVYLVMAAMSSFFGTIDGRFIAPAIGFWGLTILFHNIVIYESLVKRLK